MKVLSFAASNSKKSINKQFAVYAASLIEAADVEVLDINDYELPLFSEDREADLGQPQLAKDFLQKISQADLLIISFAEHNGSYTAAYKNLFDWASRINVKVFQNKDLLMLATSPGRGGAKNVLATATSAAPHFGGNLLAQYSLPAFDDNFDRASQKISNKELEKSFSEMMKGLKFSA